MKKCLIILVVICLVLALSAGFISCTPTRSTLNGAQNNSIHLDPPQSPFTRVNASGESDAQGGYILFGTYPQTVVTDKTLSAALLAEVGAVNNSELGNWKDEDDFLSVYVTYGNQTYFGMHIIHKRYFPEEAIGNRNPQGDNGYSVGFGNNYYWFKCEPIKWRILSEENGKALLFSELILDSEDYYNSNSNIEFSHNGGQGYANNYEFSNIRKWLNGTFYNRAFTEVDKELILATTLDNSAKSTNPNSDAAAINGGVNTYADGSVSDRIFLLSLQEATNVGYGFADYEQLGPTSSPYANSDPLRKKMATDYAQSRGLRLSFSYYERQMRNDFVTWPVSGEGSWWLRSPYYFNAQQAQCVFTVGELGVSNVRNTSIGVVPALRLKLA